MLGDDEAHRGRQSEPERTEREERLDAASNPVAHHQQERAARPESEQRHADHQEGEVVPLHDREQSGQQNLVAEGGGGEHRYRSHHREAGPRSAPGKVVSAILNPGAHLEIA